MVNFIDSAVNFLGLQKKPPLDLPTTDETKNTLTSYKSPYYSQSYDYPYNPDDLVKKKGGLEVYEKMLTDEQVKAALRIKINAILGNGWTMEPGDESAAAKEQADFITHCFTDGMEGSFRRNQKDMLTALAFGFSVTEINYVNLEQGPFAGKIGLKSLITRPPHSFEFPKDDKGFLTGVTQNTASGPLKMNMDVVKSKLIVYSYDAQFGGEYGQSDLRAAYRSWWSKDIITRFMNIYLERFGTGILVGRYPRGMKKAEQEDLEAMIKNITAKTAFKVPDEVKFEILEGKASATAIFVPVLEYYNKAISRSVLLPDKLGFTDSDGGSYNLGQNQFNLFYLLLEDIRQEFAETAINEQLVVRLIDLNYNTAIYPTFKFKPLTEKDKAAMATTFISAVKEGVIVETEKDEEYLRDSMGFIKRDANSPVIPRPAPASPFGNPPAPGAPEKPAVGQNQPGSGQNMADEAGGRWITVSGGPVFIKDGQSVKDAIATRDKKREQKVTGKRPEITGAEKLSKESRAELEFADKGPRQPNTYEKAINFTQEKQDIDKGEEKYKVDTGKQIMDMKDDLLATIARKKIIEEQNFDEVDKLELKNLGDLKNIFGAMYRSAFATGKTHGRTEIRAKKGESFAVKTTISNLPPKEAIAYFDRKKFTLAGTERDYILKNVKNLLYEGIKVGKPTNEVVYNIEEFFDTNYSTVTDLPDGEQRIDEIPGRVETVVRTNYTDAYNQGKLASFQDEGVADFIPAYEYSAIMDDRTSEICIGLDGLIYKANDPIWQKIIPPNHFNCRSTIIPILSDEEYEISDYPDPAVMPDRAFGG